LAISRVPRIEFSCRGGLAGVGPCAGGGSGGGGGGGGGAGRAGAAGAGGGAGGRGVRGGGGGGVAGARGGGGAARRGARARQGEEPQGIGADSRHEVGRRVAAAVLETVSEVDDDGVLVVVAHGAAITLGLTHLLDLDSERWFGLAGLDNCAWALVGPNPGRRPGWRLTAHNLRACEGGGQI